MIYSYSYQNVGLIELPDEIGKRASVGEKPDTDSQRRSSGDLQNTKHLGVYLRSASWTLKVDQRKRGPELETGAWQFSLAIARRHIKLYMYLSQ